jgi:hypothetical protein
VGDLTVSMGFVCWGLAILSLGPTRARLPGRDDDSGPVNHHFTTTTRCAFRGACCPLNLPVMSESSFLSLGHSIRALFGNLPRAPDTLFQRVELWSITILLAIDLCTCSAAQKAYSSRRCCQRSVGKHVVHVPSRMLRRHSMLHLFVRTARPRQNLLCCPTVYCWPSLLDTSGLSLFRTVDQTV